MTLEDVLARRTAALGGDPAALHGAVTALANCLDGVGADPAVQLDELGERLGASMRVTPERRPDLALSMHEGDELILAAGIAAAAHRRGLAVDLLLGARRALVAHHDVLLPMVLSPEHDFRLIDPLDLGEPLRWATADDVDRRLGGRPRQWAPPRSSRPLRRPGTLRAVRR